MTIKTTATAVQMVSDLFIAIDSHQAASDTVNITYVTRGTALKALKDAGFTSVQDGRKKGKPAKFEVPNDAELKEFFTSRFVSMVKERHIKSEEAAKAAKAQPMPYVEPTDLQIAANLKQQISALNYYLKTGTFTTNAGRDIAKNEMLETAKLIHSAERKAEAEAEKAKKEKAKLLKAAAAKAEAEAAAAADAAAEEITRAEAAAAAAAEAEALAAALAAAEAMPVSKKAAAAIKKAEAAIAKAADAAAATKAAEEAAAAEAIAATEELSAEVNAAAAATVAANKAAADAAAEVERLKAEAAKKKEGNVKTDPSIVNRIFKNAVDNLTEVQVSELIEKLQDFLENN